jgi:hypothetical protein
MIISVISWCVCVCVCVQIIENSFIKLIQIIDMNHIANTFGNIHKSRNPKKIKS